MNSNNIQLDEKGLLRHFLTIDGLKRQQLIDILDAAEAFVEDEKFTIKRAPLLRGKVIANLFFENSASDSSFELAARNLSADTLILDISNSAIAKGETLLDTCHNLEAMQVDMFVVSHSESGTAHFIAQHTSPGISVINAGDGRNADPTQAMLDMLTIRRHKGEFHHLKVAIIGDLLHSRTARSQIAALNTLEVEEVRVIAPKTLLPIDVRTMGVHTFHDIEEGINNVDVVIILSLPNERIHSAYLPSKKEYFRLFGLTEKRLGLLHPDAIVMHPGPINRGVEMDSGVADGERSVILQQTTYGIAVRMAVMSMCMHSREKGAEI